MAPDYAAIFKAKIFRIAHDLSVNLCAHKQEESTSGGERVPSTLVAKYQAASHGCHSPRRGERASLCTGPRVGVVLRECTSSATSYSSADPAHRLA